MTAYSRIAALALASALLVGVGAATFYARAGAPAGTGAAGGDKLDLRTKTASNMVNEGRKAVRGMEKKLTASFAKLEEAIAQNKPAVVTARNEAITPMNGLVKLAEQSLLTMEQKAAEKDRDGVEHEYVKILIAEEKVNELYAQVVSAGGVGDVESTEVKSTLTVSGDLPPDEAAAEQFMEPSPAPEPPISASAYF